MCTENRFVRHSQDLFDWICGTVYLLSFISCHCIQKHPSEMFRLSGLPQIDAAEEKRRVRENVKSNVFSFVLLCAAIRLGKSMLKCIQILWNKWKNVCSFEVSRIDTMSLSYNNSVFNAMRTLCDAISRILVQLETTLASLNEWILSIWIFFFSISLAFQLHFVFVSFQLHLFYQKLLSSDCNRRSNEFEC